MGSMPSLQAFFPSDNKQDIYSFAKLNRLTKIPACLLAVSLVMSSKGMLMRKFMSYEDNHMPTNLVLKPFAVLFHTDCQALSYIYNACVLDIAII